MNPFGFGNVLYNMPYYINNTVKHINKTTIVIVLVFISRNAYIKFFNNAKK